MFIVVSVFFTIAVVELAIIIWLIICLLDELKELGHHKPRPIPRTCL